jgi:hypothetical protein
MVANVTVRGTHLRRYKNKKEIKNWRRHKIPTTTAGLERNLISSIQMRGGYIMA